MSKFSGRLKYLGVVVNELTGDMQMTRVRLSITPWTQLFRGPDEGRHVCACGPCQAEIAETHVIVTTPEKWDVVTRKNTGDVGLAQQARMPPAALAIGLTSTDLSTTVPAQLAPLAPLRSGFSSSTRCICCTTAAARSSRRLWRARSVW